MRVILPALLFERARFGAVTHAGHSTIVLVVIIRPGCFPETSDHQLVIRIYTKVIIRSYVGRVADEPGAFRPVGNGNVAGDAFHLHASMVTSLMDIVGPITAVIHRMAIGAEKIVLPVVSIIPQIVQ